MRITIMSPTGKDTHEYQSLKFIEKAGKSILVIETMENTLCYNLEHVLYWAVEKSVQLVTEHDVKRSGPSGTA